MKRRMLAAALCACAIGCQDDPGNNVVVDGNNTTTTANSGSNQTTVNGQTGPNNVTVVDAPFGLDERPTNTTCLAGERPPETAAVTLERAFPSLSFSAPLWLEQEPGAERWFVIEQGGVVRAFTGDDASSADVVLDLRDRVTSGGERGLLGMAFHPDWPQNKTLFVSYTGNDNGLQSYVSSFTSNDDGATFDPASETRIISAAQPYGNHNGGQIAFGPDGYLYISWGDGGSGGDPEGNGQNVNTLLGAMLRIDPLGGDPYAVPSDNPFANGGGAAEIFAWGLRNVWRFSFDSATGELWAADVGQNAYEEVSILELGGNYGWADKEGFACFDVDPCDDGPWIDPVYDYPHSEGESVTGGYVYRGSAIPELIGRYVFGDFRSGRIWALRYDENGDYEAELINDSGRSIASFAEGPDGELFVIDYGGQIFSIRPTENSGNTDAGPAALLSQTGCVDPADPSQPSIAMIPYQPNAPFWSDAAVKRRWMSLPDGEVATVGEDGDWLFPNGTVLMKSFELDGQMVETRLFMRHDDGSWAGYSYRWNEEGTDAELLRGGEVRHLASGQQWIYPSRGECMQCHTDSAGRSLGIEHAQLDGDFVYASTARRSNQLDTLVEIGVVEGTAEVAPLVDPFGSAALDDRARAYLHTNCASCHRPGVAARAEFDLRYDTPLDQTDTVDVEPVTSDLGVEGARRLVPGDASRSMLWHRPNRRDAQAMPPIGSAVVDDAGVDLIEEWINQL
jgi:uncharacterized repeat protein (TIGR03806 family)